MSGRPRFDQTSVWILALAATSSLFGAGFVAYRVANYHSVEERAGIDGMKMLADIFALGNSVRGDVPRPTEFRFSPENTELTEWSRLKQEDRARSRPLGDKPTLWGYSGLAAPSFWADLSPENILCGEGRSQSPLDLRRHGARHLDAAMLQWPRGELQVTPVRDRSQHAAFRVLRPVFTEHHLRRYRLTTVHLHTPSEHLLEGVPFAAELQLIFEADAGKIALGIFLSEMTETEQQLRPLGLTALLTGDGSGTFGPLPDLKTHEFFDYLGSETSPPCREQVRWFISLMPAGIESEALTLLMRRYGVTARPVQGDYRRDIVLRAPEHS